MRLRIFDQGDPLTDAFLSAPLTADGWTNALFQLSEYTGSSNAQLLAIGGKREMMFNALSHQPSTTWEDEFLEIGGTDPQVNWRIASTKAPLVVVGEEVYAQIRNTPGRDLYNDFTVKYDMMHGCQTVLHIDNGRFFGLATLRSRADGVIADPQRELFSRIAPVALYAIRLQYALEHEALLLAKGAMEAMQAVAFIMDASGRVRAMTGAAERYLEQPSGLRLRDNELACAVRSENSLLQRAIGSVLSGLYVPEAMRFWVSSPDGVSEPRLCEVHALPPRANSFGFDGRVMVVLRAPALFGQSHRALLQTLFRLTDAEAHVATCVAEGMSREEVAVIRGTSLGTVNAQLKSIFLKTGVRREAELAAVINRLMR